MASGKLWLVSLGPGDPDLLTPRARAVLSSADVVVGYGGYLDMVITLLDLQRQRTIRRPLGAELQRASEALALARAGQQVALVSSGDIGIYGMAGPVWEQILTTTADPDDLPAIEVVPGVSALQAAAAALGSPIAHDFCTISLSDLLTPWPVIERRVAAAGVADFVIAFYNPRSRERDWQLDAARRLLLDHRAPTTPVAVARAVSRPEQQLTLTTLRELDVTSVDMSTLVLIGNSTSRQFGQWIATPRGYTTDPDGRQTS